MKTLALFDLDNTLLAGDSDKTWNQFLIDRGILDAEASRIANDQFYADYCAGTLDMEVYLAFALEPLTRFSKAELDALHQDFMRDYIRPMMMQEAQALVKQHLDAGALVMIITATNRFVTGPIAAAFGVPHLIATEAEMIDNRYTGKSFNVPCFQSGKITRLEQWFAEQNLDWSSFDDSWFYSDSHNDLPLMKLVKHPVAVDPDPMLKRYADQHGWPVISLRTHHRPAV